MNLDRYHGPVLALFRIVVGLMFLCHGVASLFGVLGGNQGTGQAVEFASWPGWWAALIQLVCGALVLLGLFTRPSAVLASGSMAYAYFVVHQPHALLPLNNGENSPPCTAGLSSSSPSSDPEPGRSTTSSSAVPAAHSSG